MSGSSGSTNSTVTNKTDIPAWLQNSAISNLDYANTIAGRDYQSYSGQQVADLTPDQQAAYSAVRNNLNTSSDAIRAAANNVTGSNLTTTAQSLLNPYLGAVEAPALKALGDQAARTANTTASEAAGAGAFGGTRFGVQQGIAASETAQKAGQLSANIRSEGWDKAVSTALSQADEVSKLQSTAQTTGLSAASALSSAGYQEQQTNQAKLTAAMQDWQDQWNYPLQQLAIREGAVTSTPYGGTTTSTQPITKANSTLSTLGSAISGAAAGSTFGPWGTAAGALIGGVGGYLGSR